MVFSPFMSHLAVLAAIAALLLSRAAGQTRWAGDEAQAPRIGIFLDFDRDPSASSIAAMEREVGAVLKATGARFSWFRFSTGAQSETFDDLAVLRFQGSCNMLARDSDPSPAPLR